MKNRNSSVIACLVAFVMSAVIVGCAGGGGGGGGGGGAAGGGTTGGGPTPVAGVYVEFVALNRAGTFVDALNLRPGDSISLKLANFDSLGNRTELPVSSWTLIGPTFSQMNLSGNVLTVNSALSSFGIIRARANISGTPQDIDQEVWVATGNTRVSGKVIADVGATGVVYAQVDIFNAGGTRVGAARTGAGGNFIAYVPTTSTEFNIKADTIPTSTFFRQLRYQSKYYPMSGEVCAPDLPTIVANSVTPLPASVFVLKQTGGPPPPPPDGCSLSD